MPVPILNENIKYLLESYLNSKGWYFTENSMYVVTYCFRCGLQRHHMLIGKHIFDLAGKTVVVYGFRCTWCEERKSKLVNM